MSGYFTKGWQVVVTTPRMGGSPPMVELYVVAIEDEQAAKDKVQELIGAGTELHDWSVVKPNLMEGFRLFEGQWTTIPVGNNG